MVNKTCVFSMWELWDVARIIGLFNVLIQKVQPLLFDKLPDLCRGFACHRGGDLQFFRKNFSSVNPSYNDMVQRSRDT